MKHDTHSAADEAIPFTTGVGRECLNGSRSLLVVVVVESSSELRFVLDEVRMYFMPSYVVKNAPAACCVNIYSLSNDFHEIVNLQEGIVAITTLHSP